MSDPTHHSNPPSPEHPPRRRGRGWLFISTIALAAAITGGLTTRAVTQGFGGHWHGRGFAAAMTPAELEDRADRAIRHAAIEIDATNEQQDKLRAIAKSAVKDLVPIRDKARSARERAEALLVQPNLDKAAIEAFRVEHMALAEAASKRFAQALGEAAEVLTAEQRRKIAERIQWRRDRWRNWHRG